ncbi:TPA: gfo/Idh/MocA family oxidoreductase, partial [Candidatus Latescibacteria bacterium]|nr:gfo/Idh/MocA family oxidoreductase [Candidatus Latescibacterota bacterium]
MGKLTALTLGAGFAGQGHSEAFRYHGVEIAGMASRTADVVERVAGEMGIPYAG